MARRPRLRLSLLGRFCVMGLLVVALLGTALALLLRRQLEHRALARAERLALITAEVGAATRLDPGDLDRMLSAERVSALNDMVDALRGEEVRRLRLYDRRGLVAYSDTPGVSGTLTRDASVEAALRGRTVARLAREGPGAPQVLEVFEPLRLDGRVEGALELHVSYAPIAANIGRDSRSVALLLAAGLALLFGTLFRIVQGASRDLRHQALHDALTGLPNRAGLYARMERALARGELTALLLIDLDRFKEINDTLGHDAGDELLQEVARRLGAVLRRHDTLARLGGDEFAVLLPGLPHRGVAADLGGRLLDALGRPFTVDGVAVELGAGVGVALAPEHGTEVGTLVRRADVAMYEAKADGRGLVTYDRARDPYSADRLALLAELRGALRRDELVLHHQPKVDVASGALVGVEALVRWQHPVRGLLGPAEFVPLAERTGMVAELTRWVVESALAESARWRSAGLDLPVAVNLAAANVLDADLPAWIGGALARHGVPGNRLECEISEHTVMADPARALDVLARLRALGVRLSLDDFGTGQSSLAYLKRLPIDEVKIDRAFVMGMAEDADDAVIVRSTIELAHGLGLTVVAEGVETAAVLRELGRLRCDVAQGYHLSRPLPAPQLEAWVASRRSPV